MTVRRAARRLRSLLLGAALAALTASPAARAEGVADEAELHFQLGAEAYAKGDFRAALEHFFLSNRLAPNRNVVFNIARAFEQMHRFADAHRHYVDARQGETDPQALKDVGAAIARIAPNVAVLDVETTPPGATLYVDRRELGSRGRAPRPLALPPGRYRIVAELEGYEPATSGEVEARLGQSTKVALALTRIEGTVHVDVTGNDGGSRPQTPGAAPPAVVTVRADDDHGPPLCTAPCDAALPPGVHQLYFTGEGLRAAPRQVTVVARQTVRVTAEMAPRTGSLLVSADEVGAQVLIGGKTVGFTPAVIPGVPAGVQAVKVSLPGYKPVEQSVEIKAGEQAQLVALELVPVHEVTAVSRYAEKLEDAPSSVSVIDGQELRAFGYPTIAEALRGTRGIYTLNDRAYTQIGVRGIGQPNDYGNKVLVLSDGQPLNDNLLNSSYVGSDGRSDLHDIERIEVVRGPGSLLYGTGALEGVINLTTRARDEPNGVHVGIGTYDDAVLRARAGFHYNFGPDRGIWASGSVSGSNGGDVSVPVYDASTKATTPVTAHGADRFLAYGTAGRFWWGPFTLQWFFHTREQQIPVGAYGTVVNDLRTQFTDTRWMAEARYEPRLSDYVQLMTRAHANRYTFLGNYAITSADPTHLEHYYGTWFGAEARVVVTPRPWLRLTAGGEAQFDPQASMDGCCAPNPVTNVVGSYLGVSKPYQFGAGYALAEGSPVSWLRISAGARVDGYSTFGAILVPRAALIFKPAPGSGNTIKLMGGRAFRAPSIYEQLYNDGGITQSVAQDPAHHLSLAPESTYSGELEVSQRFLEDWTVLATGYASYVQDLIRSLPVPDYVPPASDPMMPAPQRYVNTAPVLAVGGEAEIRREWRKGWMLAAVYGYQSARLLTATPGDPDTRLAAYPDHMASLKAVAPIVPELVSAALRLTVESPRRISTINDDRTDAVVLGDVTVSGNVKAFGLRYVVGVYNVGNFHYALPVGESFQSRVMPQNGRTFLVDLLGTYP